MTRTLRHQWDGAAYPPDMRRSLFLAYRVVGALDAGAFVRAVRTVVEQHDVLRMGLRADRQGIWRAHVRSVPAESRLISCVSVTCRSDEQFTRFVRSRLQAIIDRPWDLANDYPFRIQLIRQSPTRHALIVAFSHALLDGRSKALFTRCLWVYYGRHLADRPAPAMPAEEPYLNAVRRLASRRSGGSDVVGWQQVLSALPPRCQFGLVARPQGEASGRTDRRVVFDGSARHSLEAQCRRHRCTPFQWLLAVFASVVLDICPQDRLSVFVPTDLRRSDERGVLGMFVHVLPVAVTRQPDLTTLVRHVRAQVLLAVARRHAYGAALAATPEVATGHWGVALTRNLAANMLDHPTAEPPPEQPELSVTWDFVSQNVHPPVGLEMDVIGKTDRLVVELGFDRSLFTDTLIADLVTLFAARCAGGADAAVNVRVGPAAALLPLRDPEGSALLYADASAIERVLCRHPSVVTATVDQARPAGHWSELVARVTADKAVSEAELRSHCDSAHDPDRFVLTPERLHISVVRSEDGPDQPTPARDSGTPSSDPGPS